MRRQPFDFLGINWGWDGSLLTSLETTEAETAALCFFASICGWGGLFWLLASDWDWDGGLHTLCRQLRLRRQSSVSSSSAAVVGDGCFLRPLSLFSLLLLTGTVLGTRLFPRPWGAICTKVHYLWDVSAWLILVIYEKTSNGFCKSVQRRCMIAFQSF